MILVIGPPAKGPGGERPKAAAAGPQGPTARAPGSGMMSPMPERLLALLLLAAAPPAGAATLTAQSYVLPNGLTVLLNEDRSTPVVAVNLWYKVGSKNEAPGKTGFAHFFEHYMFEGSQHVPAGGYFKSVFGAGGVTNANTALDRTDYFAVVPAERLEEVLRLESDRMGFLQQAMTQRSFEKQRAIVENEKRMDENQPYGRAYDALLGTTFDAAHPYHSPTIGSMADLDAASVADARAFHGAFYNPNNCILAVSGDQDPAATLALVQKWFGVIPRGPDPAPLNLAPVRLTAERRAQQTDPKARLPMLLIAYPMPGEGKPGAAELEVAAAVLGGGRTSRLERALKDRRRLALSVEASVMSFQETGLFVVQAIPAPGVSLDVLEAAVRAEVADLARTGPDARELSRVRAGLRTSRFDALQKAENVAEQLVESTAVTGDPAGLQRIEDAALSAGPQAVKGAAARALAPENSAVIRIVPQGGAS